MWDRVVSILGPRGLLGWIEGPDVVLGRVVSILGPWSLLWWTQEGVGRIVRTDQRAAAGRGLVWGEVWS